MPNRKSSILKVGELNIVPSAGVDTSDAVTGDLAIVEENRRELTTFLLVMTDLKDDTACEVTIKTAIEDVKEFKVILIVMLLLFYGDD